MTFSDAEFERLMATVESQTDIINNYDTFLDEDLTAKLAEFGLVENSEQTFLHTMYSARAGVLPLKLHIPLWNINAIILIANAIKATSLPGFLGLKYVNFHQESSLEDTRVLNQIPITIYFLDSATEEDLAVAISRIDSVIEEIKNRLSLITNQGNIADSDQPIGKYCSATIDVINGYYMPGNFKRGIIARQEALNDSEFFTKIKKIAPMGAIFDKLNFYMVLQSDKAKQEQQSIKGFFRRFTPYIGSEDKIRAAQLLKDTLIEFVDDKNSLLQALTDLQERVKPLNHGRLSLIFRECLTFLDTQDESLNTPTMG